MVLGTSNTAVSKISSLVVVTFLWWKQTIKKLINKVCCMSNDKCHGEAQGSDKSINLNKVVWESLTMATF